jgi:hypothetical protein
MITIGIDYSLNSPAICIHTGDIFSFDNCKFRYIAQKKSHVVMNEKFYGLEKDNSIVFNCGIERYNYNKNLLLSNLFVCNKQYKVLIEDFSFGSTGRSILNIAENSATLKYCLRYEHGINYNIISPKTIKKFATGSGNASKDEMIACFEKETGFDILNFFDVKKLKNPKPVDDLVDSYYLCKYCFENF